MGRGRSGLTTANNTPQTPPKPKTTEQDYNSGGTGMFGSIVFKLRTTAEKIFGVKYKDNEYWDGYDNNNSSGAFKDWYDSATAAERKAVETYTGSAYFKINEYLRTDTLKNAPDSIKETVKNLDSAIAKAYLPKAITVWRGGSNLLVGGAKTVKQINAMKGAVVMDKGVTSTAVTKAKMWGTGGGKIGYEIVYPKGYGRGVFVDPISQNHGEQEFMAARNTRYEIIGGYKDKDGRVICRLKAIYD